MKGFCPKDRMDYQWVTVSVLGDDIFNASKDFECNGWRKVPRYLQPEMKSSDEKYIVDGAQVLMERPMSLTERAKVWEQDKADAQVLNAMKALVGCVEDGAGYARFGRPLNDRATGERKTTIREGATRLAWRLKSWMRAK